jgi:hypothetical protein
MFADVKAQALRILDAQGMYVISCIFYIILDVDVRKALVSTDKICDNEDSIGENSAATEIKCDDLSFRT